jgi:hypothetical protein
VGPRAPLIAVALLAGCAGDSTRADEPPHGDALVLPRPDGTGEWTKVLLSPDRSTYLAQWSGECEIQTAYVIPAHSRALKPITDYRRGSAESVAIGWSGSHARVRLPRGQPPSRKPGVYLVEPRTMSMSLVRRLPARTGC